MAEEGKLPKIREFKEIKVSGEPPTPEEQAQWEQQYDHYRRLVAAYEEVVRLEYNQDRERYLKLFLADVHEENK